MGKRKTRKVTVEVPEELLQRARQKGEGITQAIREALELRSRHTAYERLRALRGKIKWSVSLDELREDAD